MFSLDKFYHIVHSNLILPLNGVSVAPYPFGTYNNCIAFLNKFNTMNNILSFPESPEYFFKIRCIFLDQEPFDENAKKHSAICRQFPEPSEFLEKIYILASSEKSQEISEFIKVERYFHWYYFFHGFVALDWYRDYQYVSPLSFNRFTKVFICYNNLISNLRSYRLHLVANIIDRNLLKSGLVGCRLFDEYGTWEDEIKKEFSPLSIKAKSKIRKVFSNLTDSLIIDHNNPYGSLSAEINFEDAVLALFHIVTETVYFLPKLHLTEKIFKPIVVKRPFILVAAPGNLAYLKSYGFKTFDRWIDESYDLEQDHYLRIEKITEELEKLCLLSQKELDVIYSEMQEILEYNYNHFYGEFKKILVDELVDNFNNILIQVNNGRTPFAESIYHQRHEISPEYLKEVKQRLLK